MRRMLGIVPEVLVADPVVWVEFRCPNARCRHYLVTVPAGTLVQRGYCRSCGLRFTDQVAR